MIPNFDPNYYRYETIAPYSKKMQVDLRTKPLIDCLANLLLFEVMYDGDMDRTRVGRYNTISSYVYTDY